MTPVIITQQWSATTGTMIASATVNGKTFDRGISGLSSAEMFDDYRSSIAHGIMMGLAREEMGEGFEREFNSAQEARDWQKEFDEICNRPIEWRQL